MKNLKFDYFELCEGSMSGFQHARAARSLRSGLGYFWRHLARFSLRNVKIWLFSILGSDILTFFEQMSEMGIEYALAIELEFIFIR